MTFDIFSDIPRILLELSNGLGSDVGVGTGVIFALLPIEDEDFLTNFEFFKVGLSIQIIPLLDDLTK